MIAARTGRRHSLRPLLQPNAREAVALRRTLPLVLFLALLATGCGAATPSAGVTPPQAVRTQRGDGTRIAGQIRMQVQTAPLLDAIGFAGVHAGWAGGNGEIVGTNGRQWTTEWRGKGTVTQIVPVSAEDAVAVTDQGLLRTTNGGRSWISVQEPGGAANCLSDLGAPCIVNAAFPTSSVGYAVAAPPALVGTQPGWVAIAPSGTWMYVANQSGTVTAYNLATGRIAWFVRVGQAPTGIAVSPDGGAVYVANQNSDTLSIIDPHSRRVAATLHVVQNPCAVAVSPSGRRVFVASASGGLSVVDAQTRRQIAVLPTGGSCSLSFSPSGKRLYVAADLQREVDVIDTATDTIVNTLAAGQSPWAVAVSADGRRLYVAESMEPAVLVLDTRTGAQVASWRTSGTASAVALDARKRLLYVVTANAIDVLDAASGKLVRRVPASSIGVQGIAIAPGGAAAYTENGGAVLRIPAGAGSARSLAASGVAVDAMLGTPMPDSGGALYRTQNAGATWQRIAVPVRVQSVCFTSATQGFAAYANSVYRTNDAGGSWRLVYRAPLQAPSGAFGAVLCRGSEVVLQVAGMGAAMGHAAYIAFLSSDGGASWQASIEENYTHPGAPGVNAPEGPGSYPGPFTLTAGGEPVYGGSTPALNAAAVGTVRAGALVAHAVSGAASLAGIAFPTASEGWALTSGSGGGRILHTTDGGATWQLGYPATPAPVDGIAFPSASTGYGIGMAGDARAVLKTVNGGRTWVKISDLPASPNPYPGPVIAFSSASTGFAVSAGGVLYRTVDGGRSWQSAGIQAQTVAAAGDAVCAGTASGFVASTDGGATWHGAGQGANSPYACAAEQQTPAWRKATSAFGGGASVAGTVGARAAWVMDAGAVYRTVDGGATWQEIVVPAADQSDPPVLFSFPSMRVGYMLTAAGEIYRSVDGGVRWTALP